MNIENIKNSESVDAKPVDKSALGILKQYANPELIPLEKDAWGKAVADKCTNN